MDTTVTTTDVPSWARWRQSVQEARDSMTVRRVFGEPIERGGSTIIPAALVFGGAAEAAAATPRGTAGAAPGSGFGPGRWAPTSFGAARSAGSRRWT